MLAIPYIFPLVINSDHSPIWLLFWDNHLDGTTRPQRRHGVRTTSSHSWGGSI